MKFYKAFFKVTFSLLLFSCLGFSKKDFSSNDTQKIHNYTPSKDTKVAYFASGCFGV